MAENTTVVAASRARVFEVLADGWTYSNWVVGTSHMRAVEAAWPAAGSRLFHASGSWPVVTRDETVVERCEPGSGLVLRAQGGVLGSAQISLELADDTDGCRVTMRETPVAGPGRWMPTAVTDAVLRRRNTESLARLAAICERRTVGID